MLWIAATFLMLAKGPIVDRKHVLGKLKKFVELVKTRREIEFRAISNATYTRNASASQQLPSLDNYEWTEFDEGNFSFGETQGEWFAFKGTLQIPETFDASRQFLHFDFDIERKYLVRQWDDDFPAGPEGRFWIDGQVVAAIDEFHSGAVIEGGSIVELRIFSGRCAAAHKLRRFGVSVIDKNTESLYQRVRFLVSVIEQLEKESIDRELLIGIVDNALRELDIRDLSYPISLPKIRMHDPNGDVFYKSVPKALATLKEELAKLPKPAEDDPGISVIGYSHLDTCWEWPYSLSHFKSANTAAGMIHLMNHPPHEFGDQAVPWKFLATAPQHYKWLKVDAPDVYEKVMAEYKKGRWDVNGAMWVEPDTTLPSGESLVRQLVMGVRYFEKEIGAKQTVVFLPDCFGFTASLPQLMRKAGIDSFVTAKISWCEYTQFPHSTFKWRGIDGSDVFTHFITTPSSWSYQTSTYTGVSNAYEMIGTLKTYKQRNILPRSALHTSGNGDGGGGITEEMVWNLNLMAELPKLRDVPTLRFPTLETLFKDIREKGDILPVWDDELYLEYHRGTLTTQEEVKRQNRQLEAHLHTCEWLAVIVQSVVGKNVSTITAELEAIWEDTLLFHFHDAIPGSSINEANIDIIEKGRPCLKRLREFEAELAASIAGEVRTVTSESASIVFNSLAHSRYVMGEIVPSGGWTVLDGKTHLPVDTQETTVYERVAKDESFILKILNEPFVETVLPPTSTAAITFDNATKTVRTPFMIVQFSEDGTMTSVKDAQSGREFLSAPGNSFEFYEDRPLNWPAWDIQLYHKEMQLPGPTLESLEFDHGCVSLKFRIPEIGEGAAGTTTISQVVTFSESAPFIDFKTVVDWKQHNKLLKVAFPTTVRSRFASFGIQFGHIQRPTHKNTERDVAKFESSGRWADLSDSTGGVSICSDVKAGFDVHENIMRMSLLKAPLQTDKWADFGIRKFAYRVAFHADAFCASSVTHLSDELTTPVTAVPYVHPTSPISDDAIPATAEFVVVDNANIIVETLKPAYESDGFIVRLYESSGGWGRATVRFPLLDNEAWTASPVDLLERACEGSVTHTASPGQFSFTIDMDSFEVSTVLVKRI